MSAEPDFEREDREDAPFLASESNASGSADNHIRNDHAKPTRPVPVTASAPTSASRITFRLKLILFAMVLAVEVGFAFLEGPMVRVMESIACRQYYSETDPTKIGANGQVPEELCKLAEIQAELAAVKGYHMFFDGLLSMLLMPQAGLGSNGEGNYATFMLTAFLFWYRRTHGFSLWSAGRPPGPQIDPRARCPRVLSELDYHDRRPVVLGYTSAAGGLAIFSGLVDRWWTSGGVCDHLDDDG
jgi:hypothetical protein